MCTPATSDLANSTIDNPYLKLLLPRIRTDRFGTRWPVVVESAGGDVTTATSLQEQIAHDRRRADEASNRYDLVRKYAWATPTPSVLSKVADFEPIVEFGAGTGYWAYLLRQMHVDIVAIDIEPPSSDSETNPYHPGQRPWTTVVRGCYEDLVGHAHRSLFLCWPPGGSDMALRALLTYQGDTLLYLGEGLGGCNGDDAFHTELERRWTKIDEQSVLQWEGMRDRLCVFQRLS